MAVTVATLIDNAKALADKRGDASIPDADWLQYVNWGVQAFWRLLCSLDPGAYFTTAPNSVLAGGVSGSTIDLGALTPTWAALHGLDLNPDTVNRRTIRRRPFAERNIGVAGWWLPTTFADDRAYDLRGRILTITPYEVAAGTYRVYYRAQPYLFTGAADATALDWQIEPYAEYVAIQAARKGLDIEESNSGPWAARLGELIEEITSEHTRDDEEAARIADVEDDTARLVWR